MKLSSLSVFFPCLNDAWVLPELIWKTYSVLPKISDDYEVIIVNDGSTDNTCEIVKKLQKKYSHLKIINHARNGGYGRALQTGFAAARKDWVFYTDGDGQYDPTEAVKLAKKAAKDIDIVNGFKINRQDNLLRRITGSLYNRIIHCLYKIPIRDVDCDFRLIRKSILSKIKLTSSSGIICLELVYKLNQAGARFRETGVSHYPRKYGRSQFFKFESLVKTLRDNWRFFRAY